MSRWLLPFRIAVGRGRSNSSAEHLVSQNCTRVRESSVTTAGELAAAIFEKPLSYRGFPEESIRSLAGIKQRTRLLGAFPGVIRPASLNGARRKPSHTCSDTTPIARREFRHSSSDELSAAASVEPLCLGDGQRANPRLWKSCRSKVLRQAFEKLQNAPIGVTDVFADEP
jgi:hypothetical protein